MKRLALALTVAALAGCAATPVPILRPGQQIVIEPKGSPVAGFDILTKGRQTIAVRTEPAPTLDRALFAPRYSQVPQ